MNRLRALAVLTVVLAGIAIPTLAGAQVPPAGSIKHIVVVELENESESASFGAKSPAPYLAKTLAGQGVLIKNYYAIGHVSLPNYIAEVSGQAPNPTTQGDCIASGFTNVSPGTPVKGTKGLGQVHATSGCVYPKSVETIANQIDQIDPPDPTTHVASWRAYEEDMGNDQSRDGGATCGHPAIGKGTAWLATSTDGYVTRHDPFMWFHSIIDDAAECKANVVPLGTVNAQGVPNSSSPLVQDFSSEATTPAFSFITPSVCDDGHDAVCTSPSAAGGTTGGLKAANAWLKDWMPTILNSPAYQDGSMVVVVTFDEAADTDTTSCCNEATGPNVKESGINGPGGGKIGALILTSSSYITPGTVDSTGKYDHYSALRTYEDLLGITTGGSDGQGHLGMAGATGLKTFGDDVFDAPTTP